MNNLKKYNRQMRKNYRVFFFKNVVLYNDFKRCSKNNIENVRSFRNNGRFTMNNLV